MFRVGLGGWLVWVVIGDREVLGMGVVSGCCEKDWDEGGVILVGVYIEENDVD